jgi:hypothetical protein
MKSFGLWLALSISGCGHRAIPEFTHAEASRLPDGRIEVKGEIECKVMMGVQGCGLVCPTAEWSASGTPGVALDRARVCGAHALKPGDKQPFAMTSTIPIPTATHAQIRVDADSTDIMQLTPRILPSP